MSRRISPRFTIGLLMLVIAVISIPIFLVVPLIRFGGIPHHMTTMQTVRWLTIERDSACTRCHQGTERKTAFLPSDDATLEERSERLASFID